MGSKGEALYCYGKHYLFQEIGNPSVKRHYTLSKVIEPKLYSQYLRMLKENIPVEAETPSDKDTL